MLIIDRFEGDYAVCEWDGVKMLNLKRALLPPDAVEGDVLLERGGRYEVDAEATRARRERLRGKMDRLFE